MADIWIVDDEPSICWALKKTLTADGHVVQVFPAAEPFLKSIRETGTTKPRLLMLDVRLPGASGLEVLRWMSKEFPSIPVIIMTAFGDLKVAVDAIQGKAFEYLTKPFSLDVALQSVVRALRQDTQDKHSADPRIAKQLEQDLLFGCSSAMQQAYKQIAVAANVDATVMIEGEPGTGKSLVAEMVHKFSARSAGPLLSFRTSLMNPNGEAEIFGLRAPGTATVVQTGLIELASHGTLIIDEVSQLPISTQSKILSAIESKTFYALAHPQPTELTARLFFTTAHELDNLVDDNELLPSLRSHLEICRICLPPLRQRREDIRPMIQGLLSTAGVSQTLAITEQALQHLERRQWPGNIRELRQAIQYAAVRAKGGVIQVEDLPPESLTQRVKPAADNQELRQATRRWISDRNASLNSASDEKTNVVEGFLYEECLAIVEESMIEQMMDELNGNRAAVAQRLGIHRSTLRQKMKRFDHDRPDA